VSPDSASRNTRRISSSLGPRLPITRSPLVLPENHPKQKSSTSTWLSFWVLGHTVREMMLSRTSRKTRRGMVNQLISYLAMVSVL